VTDTRSASRSVLLGSADRLFVLEVPLLGSDVPVSEGGVLRRWASSSEFSEMLSALEPVESDAKESRTVVAGITFPPWKFWLDG